MLGLTMHANGNRFMLMPVSERMFNYRLPDLVALLHQLGLDQLLWFKPRCAVYTYDYRIFNADGSESEQCGNGALCVGYYLSRQLGLDTVTLLTYSQKILVDCTKRQPVAVIGPIEPVSMSNRLIKALGSAVYQVGNTHVVIQVKDVEAVNLDALYHQIQSYMDIPINLEVYSFNYSMFRVRIFERGVGETLSCGSGLCCVAMDVFEKNKSLSKVCLVTRGGASTVEKKEHAHVALSAMPELII